MFLSPESWLITLRWIWSLGASRLAFVKAVVRREGSEYRDKVTHLLLETDEAFVCVLLPPRWHTHTHPPAGYFDSLHVGGKNAVYCLSLNASGTVMFLFSSVMSCGQIHIIKEEAVLTFIIVQRFSCCLNQRLGSKWRCNQNNGFICLFIVQILPGVRIIIANPETKGPLGDSHLGEVHPLPSAFLFSS